MCSCDRNMSASATLVKYAYGILLAFITVQGLILGASSAPVPTLASRLLSPCAGSTGVESSQPAPEVTYVDHELYHDLAVKAQETRGLVRNLMSLYARERFQNEDFENESRDLNVDLPKLETATTQYLSDVEAKEEAHKSYEFLAIVTVHLEQAILEEDFHEGGAYNQHFMNIKETGMFWMTCQLHKIISMHEEELQEDKINEALNRQITDVTNSHTRRTRDFVLLRDLAVMLERTSTVFSHLKRVAETQGSS